VSSKKRRDTTLPVGPSILTVAEVARYLRVHPSTIYRLLRIGKLPAFRLGSEWRFNREQIDEFRFGGNAPKARNK
jgi:excisionase family DNA binding protein